MVRSLEEKMIAVIDNYILLPTTWSNTWENWVLKCRCFVTTP
jgi:hypothetical protein